MENVTLQRIFGIRGCAARGRTRFTGVTSPGSLPPTLSPSCSLSLLPSRSLSEVPLGHPREQSRSRGGRSQGGGMGTGLSCQPTARAGRGEWAGPGMWAGSEARDSQAAINPPGAAGRRAGASPETPCLGVPPQEPREGHRCPPPIHPFIHLPSVCRSLALRLLLSRPSHPAP